MPPAYTPIGRRAYRMNRRLHDNQHAVAVENLHQLLRRHGTVTLARFADLLL